MSKSAQTKFKLFEADFTVNGNEVLVETIGKHLNPQNLEAAIYYLLDEGFIKPGTTKLIQNNVSYIGAWEKK